METCIIKVQKRGNSLGVSLPRPVAHALHWRRGLHIEASVRGDVLELAAVQYRQRGEGGAMSETTRVDLDTHEL